MWVALTSRHQARASKPSSQQCGEVFRRAFFFMTEESKENPPPGIRKKHYFEVKFTNKYHAACKVEFQPFTW